MTSEVYVLTDRLFASDYSTTEYLDKSAHECKGFEYFLLKVTLRLYWFAYENKGAILFEELS